MFGLGAALDLSMLRNTLARPYALFVGLAGQLLLLPILAFLVASIGPWPPFIAIALVIHFALPWRINIKCNCFFHSRRPGVVGFSDSNNQCDHAGYNTAAIGIGFSGHGSWRIR